MLYEVITIRLSLKINTGLRLNFASRITSYNVCYTKLLRDGEFRGTSLDIKAYAAFAGVEAAVSKVFNPYVAVRFASGDDNSSDSDVEGFVGITDIGRFTPLMGMDGNILGEPMGTPYGNVLYFV